MAFSYFSLPRKVLLGICLSGIVAGAGNAAEGDACSTLFSQLNAISPDLAGAYTQIQALSPALIRGEKTPSWNDFDSLQKILTALQAGKKTVAEAGKLVELQAVITEIEKSVPGNPALLALRDATKDAHPTNLYQPTEYALKVQYQQLLWQVDRELPASLKIPGVRLPHDPRPFKLIAQAQEWLKGQEQRFEAFFPQTGFTRVADLRSALANYDETAKKLVDLFDSGNVEIAMNRPESARWWVPRVGFLNQRTTGTSRGTLDNDWRNHTESALMGKSLAEYSATDDQLKPTYGYLKPVPGDDLRQSQSAKQYGTDVYVFKPDRVNNRLTWTAGDSLGIVPRSFDATAPGYPHSWREFFIPWKYRLLLVPDLLKNMRITKEGFTGDAMELEDFFPTMPVKPAPPKVDYDKIRWPSRPVRPATLPVVPPEPMAPARIPDISYAENPIYSAPALPKLPLMAKPKEGESFADAFARYQAEDATHKIQLEIDRLQAIQQQKMQAYMDRVAAVKAENEKIEAAFQQTAVYKAFLQKQQEAQAALTAFENSEEGKKYTAALADYNTEFKRVSTSISSPVWPAGSPEAAAQAAYDSALTAIQASDQYKWLSYNKSLSPYFGFAGTPLENFHERPMNTRHRRSAHGARRRPR